MLKNEESDLLKDISDLGGDGSNMWSICLWTGDCVMFEEGGTEGTICNAGVEVPMGGRC